MKNSNLMALRRNPFQHKTWLPSEWKKVLVHWLVWLLLAAGLFYGMNRYFEYRERQLDKRLEQLK